MEEYLSEIYMFSGKGKPVSLEVMDTKWEQMVKEAGIIYDKFNAIAGKVVIKSLLRPRGLRRMNLKG